MCKPLNRILSGEMEALVTENFTGVEAEWWWERRMDGGVEICQELNPGTVVAEMAGAFGRDIRDVRRVAVASLGLEDFDPVVLTFEISWNTTSDEAAESLAYRSSTANGLADNIYRHLARALRGEPG